MSVDVLASLDSLRHQQGVDLVGASLAISPQAFHMLRSIGAVVVFTPDLRKLRFSNKVNLQAL